jgi:hypothetical protein
VGFTSNAYGDGYGFGDRLPIDSESKFAGGDPGSEAIEIGE